MEVAGPLGTPARAPAGPPALQSGYHTSSEELEAPAPEAPGTRGLCPRPDASTAAEAGAPGPRHPQSVLGIAEESEALEVTVPGQEAWAEHDGSLGRPR